MAATSMTMAVVSARFAAASTRAESSLSRSGGALSVVAPMAGSSAMSCTFSDLSSSKKSGVNFAIVARAAEVTEYTFGDGDLEEAPAAAAPAPVQQGSQRIGESCAEPKWKKKLAAADEHQEKTRQATIQAQEVYRRKQDALRRQSAQAAGGGAAPSLKDLEFIPYLTEDGLIADCTQPGAKASVYAIFDEKKALCYVGVSRQVYQSMRLHFARRPRQCHYVKVMHLTKPSRAFLEGTRDSWISESGSVPEGNDNGELQNLWENALDCTTLMTDEEKLKVEEAAPGPPTAKALKQVARRIEKELEVVFKQRQCSDVLRFDPKLKDRCLLDLKGIAVQPDTSVPNSTPKPK